MGERENISILYDKIEQVQSSIMNMADAAFVIGQGLATLYGDADGVAQGCLSVIQLGLEAIGCEKIAELQEAVGNMEQE